MEHGHHPKIADHDEHHEHSHEHVHRGVEKKRLTMVAVLTGSMMVIEGIGGYVTNSLALLSDAFHMLTHFGALMISLSAIIIATRFQSEDKTFGYWRAEILTALLNGITLVPIVGYILYESYHRYLHPEPIRDTLMLVVAFVGLIYESVHVLLESVLKGIRVDEVERLIKAVSGVEDVHDIHIWQITSGMYSLTCHVMVGDMNISEAQGIVQQIQYTLDKQFHITH